MEKAMGPLGLLFERLGGVVELEKNGQVYRYKAVLQPVRDRSKRYLERGADLFGWGDRSHILYYGPSAQGGELLESGDVLRRDGQSYLVKRCEPYFFGGVEAYRWGVLQRGEEEGVF